MLTEYSLHADVPVSERSDNQSVCVAQVLIAELELGITDVDVTVSAFVIPAMAQLGQPRKGLTVCHLQDTNCHANQATFLACKTFDKRMPVLLSDL